MQLLPAPDEQEWILDGLKDLIARRGFELFVVEPVVEPTDAFFPDPYAADVRSVRAMTRRLMDYAGLSAYEADFETFQARPRLEMDEHGVLRDRGHEGTAAWFAGLEGDRCLFGISHQQLPEPDVVAATMAHEAAHAFRHVHRLALEDREADELLTDLTTVYLGLGILTCNGSFRYRASGELSGGYAITRWSTSRGGYLPPQALAFALAAQTLARGATWKEMKRTERHLETNQGGCFRAACEHLHENMADLRGRLGIPDRAAWPRPTRSPGRAPTREVGVAAPREAPRFNAGYPVFRIRRGGAVAIPVLAGVVGWLLGCVVTIALDLALGTGFQLLPPALGAAAIAAYGFARTRQLVCSDLACQTRLADTDLTCPGCGGEIRGTVRSRREVTERMDEILGTAGVPDGEGPD